MVIKLNQLFNVDGMKKQLDFKIPLEELKEIHGYIFSEPVWVKGEIYNRAGIVTLGFSTNFTLNLICDRCLEEFQRKGHYDFSHILVRSINTDNDEYIVTEGDKIELNEIAVSDLLLQLPTKILCREDCKGLCSFCGQDLNESECDCPKN